MFKNQQHVDKSIPNFIYQPNAIFPVQLNETSPFGRKPTTSSNTADRAQIAAFYAFTEFLFLMLLRLCYTVLVTGKTDTHIELVVVKNGACYSFYSYNIMLQQ